jgi:hypothetical protein
VIPEHDFLEESVPAFVSLCNVWSGNGEGGQKKEQSQY